MLCREGPPERLLPKAAESGNRVCTAPKTEPYPFYCFLRPRRVTFLPAAVYDTVSPVRGEEVFCTQEETAPQKGHIEGGSAVQIIVWKSPKLLSGLLRAIFKIK